MSNPPPRTPPENLAASIEWLGREAVARGSENFLITAVIALIIDCLRSIGEQLAHLAAGRQDGTLCPRPTPTAPRPKTPATDSAAAKIRTVVKAGAGGRRSQPNDRPPHRNTRPHLPRTGQRTPRQTHGPPKTASRHQALPYALIVPLS